MQTTIMGSIADYWINNARSGVWRRARKPQECRHGKQIHVINAGDRYLDTGEQFPGQVWATIKCCEACANAQTKLAVA